jgi:choline dehydrogenase-like flavoprotein
MPMDPIDFESRSYVPHSGWPISYEDLLPYYPAANALAEAGRFSYEADDALGPLTAPMIRGFTSDLVRTTGLERFSCPTNFGTRYQKRLQISPHIRLLVGANCVGLKLHSDGKSIRAVEVATLTGVRFTAVCRITVLASGGLETARLLLASNDVNPAGVGNAHDVVGRYYMCHIAGNVGQLSLNGPTSQVQHNYEISPEGIYCRRRISIAAGEQRRRGLANSVARLHFPRITDPSHRNGVLSGLFLARKLISYEYGKRLNDGNSASIGTYARHLLNVVTDPLDTSAFLSNWVTRRTLADRKFPSVILRNRTNRFSLEMHGEQAPLETSRVTLSSHVDALGMPKIRVDWRYSQSDIESLRGTLDLIAEEVELAGVGRFDYQRETLEEDLTRFGAYGGHHIGTARMGNDERTSVVNKDCQVHSVNNLYIAGSAVFPTSSQANPTLTLLALTLRLGDTLGKRLAAREKTTLLEEVAA